MKTLRMAALVALVASAMGIMSSPGAVAEKRKVLTFFLHERLRAPVNGTAFVIVPPLSGSTTPSNPLSVNLFGMVAVFDDSITVGPDESSLEIGRGRGFYIFVANRTIDPAIEFSWTAEFNEASGFAPGSTLTFKGFDRITAPVREIAIVGGTGELRLARGWAVITTYSLTGIGNSNVNLTAYFEYGCDWPE